MSAEPPWPPEPHGAARRGHIWGGTEGLVPIPAAAPCALPDGHHGPRCPDRGDTVVTSHTAPPNPSPPPHRDVGRREPSPPAAAAMRTDAALGWPSSHHHHQQGRGAAQPPPAHPSPSIAHHHPLPSAAIASSQRQGGGRCRAGCSACFMACTCHKLRESGSINLPGNKNQGK